LASLEKQYACARGSKNICSKEYSVFSSGIALFVSAGSSVDTSLGNFKKKIIDASKRLAEVFSSRPSKEFQRREKELLTSYYGNQAYAEKR